MGQGLCWKSARIATLAAVLMGTLGLAPNLSRAQEPAREPAKEVAKETAKPPAPAKPAAADEETEEAEEKPVVSERILAIRTRLEGAKQDLDAREKILGNRSVGTGDLLRARDGLDAVADRIRRIIGFMQPRLDAARERLNQLGPKPKEGEEGEDVAKERAEREHAVAEIDETQRLAKSLLVQSDQILDQVSNRRRAAFTRGLFERSSPLVSPDLWMRVTADIPRDLRALQSTVAEFPDLFTRHGTLPNLLLLGVAFGISAALYFGRRNIAPHVGRRRGSATHPSRHQKLLAAWRVFLIGTVPALAGSYAVYYALDSTDLMPARLMPMAGAILIGLAFVAFVQSLADALLSPDKPSWRLAPVSDAAASRLTLLAVSIAIVISVVKSIEALNSGISAALPVSIATRGLGALATVLILAIGLHRFADTQDQEEACLGPYVPPEHATTIGGPARLVGWAAVAGVGAAAIVGYVAFSAFLIDQLVWTASLFALLYLLISSADTFIGGSLTEQTRVATALQANTGLRKRSINQIAVLATGFARVALVLVAVLLALAPWGLDSVDVLTSVRTAFFGFKVGDVTVSLSTITFAVGILVLGVAVTKAIQRWLERTYLPATDLDAGLRNSISTVSGYCGFLLALALAFSYLGLSLEKLTIVAGALSVGIGFGLQSIVNNFVSGLLLLWERPIRVGDQVVIGDSEGIVKRISVRSTEIQTFDRSAVIVPNSNLISGIVKNRVRGDRTGRVTVTVSVLRNQDPVHAAELITACARQHPDVLKEPPPRIVFKKIGDPFLDFELVAMIVDVGLSLKVQSDLNFAVFKTLSEAGMIPAMGPGSSIVTVQGLEPVESALGQIASVFAGRPAARSSVIEPQVEMPPQDGTEDPEIPATESKAPVRRRTARASS
jgi:small-conductance mechanosensitive channel